MFCTVIEHIDIVAAQTAEFGINALNTAFYGLQFNFILTSELFAAYSVMKALLNNEILNELQKFFSLGHRN